MDESIKNAFGLTEIPLNMISPLTLAYIGDAVYELVIRAVVAARINGKPKDMNRRTVEAVSAKAQSEMMNVIEPMLTEEELAVYRRGRNANSSTMAKHATVAEYRRATGFEALIGYLWLADRKERLLALIREAYQ